MWLRLKEDEHALRAANFHVQPVSACSFDTAWEPFCDKNSALRTYDQQQL